MTGSQQKSPGQREGRSQKRWSKLAGSRILSESRGSVRPRHHSTPTSRMGEVLLWCANLVRTIVIRHPFFAAYTALAFGIFVVFSPERADPLSWLALVVVIAVPPMAVSFVMLAVVWILAILIAVVMIACAAVRYVVVGR